MSRPTKTPGHTMTPLQRSREYRARQTLCRAALQSARATLAFLVTDIAWRPDSPSLERVEREIRAADKALGIER